MHTPRARINILKNERMNLLETKSLPHSPYWFFFKKNLLGEVTLEFSDVIIDTCLKSKQFRRLYAPFTAHRDINLLIVFCQTR